MATTLQCPSCSRTLRVPDELLGKAVRCPGCLTTFAGVPHPAEAPAPAAASSDLSTGGGAPAGVAAVPDLTLDDPTRPGQETAAVTPSTPPPTRAEAPPDGEAPSGTRPCPYCGEQIGRHDQRCRYCGEDVAEAEDRPWDRPGRRPVRRDCEPHRGPLLLVLGIISIVVAPMVVCGCYMIGPVVPLIGMGLGIPAWVLGRRDLAKMEQGVMDPEGQGITQGGMICGIIGTILNSIGALFGIAMLVYVVFMIAVVAKTSPPVRVNPPPPAPVAPPPPKRQPGADGTIPRRLPDYLPRLARAGAAAPKWN